MRSVLLVYFRHWQDFSRDIAKVLWPNIDTLLDHLWIRPIRQHLDQLLRDEVDADGILIVAMPVHVLVCAFGVEVVDLRLDLVPVRVEVVHTRGRSVVDTPAGQDVVLLPLRIRLQQFWQCFERECHVPQAGGRGIFGCCARYSGYSDAVVLVVVAQEPEFTIVENSSSAQKLLVIVHHLVVLGRAENHMGEFVWTDGVGVGHVECFEAESSTLMLEATMEVLEHRRNYSSRSGISTQDSCQMPFSIRWLKAPSRKYLVLPGEGHIRSSGARQPEAAPNTDLDLMERVTIGPHDARRYSVKVLLDTWAEHWRFQEEHSTW
jgi:hypothetical protein